MNVLHIAGAALVGLLLAAFPAQAQEDAEAGGSESSIVEIAPPPSTAWRDEIGTLRVGVAAGDDARGTVRRMELFRESLTNKLDLPVEIVPFGDFLTLSDAQASGRVEYAIHSSLSFAMTQAACNCVEPLAVPTFSGGAKSIRMIVVARSDNADALLSGDGVEARFGVIGEAASNLHLELADALLKSSGVQGVAVTGSQMQEFEDFAAASAALASNQVDGLFGWSTLTGPLSEGYSHGTLRQLLETGLLDETDIELAWQSPEIMLGPHAVRRNLPSELKGLLQSHLLGLEGTEPAAYDGVSPDLAGGFRPVQASNYNVLKGLITSTQPSELPTLLRE
ncbi:MAG: PhnD/SsuA/transferrin family substrate-binding protein [Pseudomonadota bacterium]